MSEKRVHIIRLEKRQLRTFEYHVAVCSCGWESDFKTNRLKADEAGDDHIVAISWCDR